MSTPAVPPVGHTALLTAASREVESHRPDRLFVDPWAGILLEAHRRAGPGSDEVDLATTRPAGDSELWDFLRAYFPGRTPFFDDQVRRGVRDGAGQVVILAAGLDARAARLDLPPDLPVFEVDSEPVLAFKRQALTDAGADVARRVPVAADLAADWFTALRAAGFRRDVPTVWLAEGLLFYLDAAACDRLAGAVRDAAAPGSRIAVEYFGRNPVLADVPSMDATDTAMMSAVLSLFDEGPPAPPESWLGSFGVTVDRSTDLVAELTSQGRDVPALVDPSRPDPFRIWLAAGTFG